MYFFRGAPLEPLPMTTGSFYVASDQTYTQLSVSFIGFKTVLLVLDKGSSYGLEIVLEAAAEQLQSVTLVSGKQSKKNNPAIDILRKIWAKKTQQWTG